LPKLREIASSFAVPIIHVAHDMAELERIADGLILMEGGRIAASGQLAAMLTDFSLPFARQRDAAVVLEMVAGEYEEAYGLTRCTSPQLALTIPAQFGPGEKVRLRIRASDVSLVRERPQASSILNILPARILEAEDAPGPHMNLVLGVGNDAAPLRLLCAITRKSWDVLGLRLGEAVFAQIKAVALAESA